MGRDNFWEGRGYPIVMYRDTLRSSVQKRLNRSRCCLGYGLVWAQWSTSSSYSAGDVNAPSHKGTLAPPGEYDWTVRLLQRCGLMSNYFDHLLVWLSRLRFRVLRTIKISHIRLTCQSLLQIAALNVRVGGLHGRHWIAGCVAQKLFVVALLPALDRIWQWEHFGRPIVLFIIGEPKIQSLPPAITPKAWPTNSGQHCPVVAPANETLASLKPAVWRTRERKSILEVWGLPLWGDGGRKKKP